MLAPPGRIRPRRFASSSIATAMRSLTLPPGLNHSSFAKMRAAPFAKRESSTSGVFPTTPARETGEAEAVETGRVTGALVRSDESQAGGEIGAMSRTAERKTADGCEGPAGLAPQQKAPGSAGARMRCGKGQ